MAKQVSEILIKLGLEGVQGLDKLKGAFRELEKSIGPNNAAIERARKSVLDFGNASARTEQAIKGQLEALKGLKTQADVSSSTYVRLINDIDRLDVELRGSTVAIDQQRDALLASAKAGDLNSTAIQRQISGLDRLRQQTRPGSSAFAQLTKDIDTARLKITGLASDAQDFSRALTGIPGASLDILGRQITNNRRAMQGLRIESDEFLSRLQRISLLSARQAGLTGRQQVRASVAMYTSPEYRNYVDQRTAGLPMPETPAAFVQRRAEITAELENTEATQTSLERILSLRQELRSIQQQEQLLTKQIKLNVEGTAEAINKRIGLQRDLNQSSGFREFSARIESETAIEKSVRRARQRLERENNRLRKEAADAIQISTQLLLPAAGQTTAPGTGAALSGGARRLVPGRTESVFTEPTFIPSTGRTEVNRLRLPAAQAGLPSAAVGVAPAVGVTSDAYARQAREAFKAKESLDSYFVAIEKATRGSNDSINSLNNQRQAWEALRNAIPRTYKLYGEAGAEIQKLDKQLERSQVQRRRLSGMQLAQGAGAALSGGIFGGPEGLIGGVAGLALGGVGGAFAGAAAGAQVGMLRQQLGLVSQYVAQLNLAKTTLAQASTGQSDYNKMLTVARQVSADYAVTLQDTLRGYAQVAVAARANGLGAKEIEEVYRGVIAAGVAFGKSQADLDAIVTATVQVFSKGKLSAEELGGQLGERLPGAVAKFAAATGRTLPELAKALEEGKVNISDFVKFAQKQFSDYDSIAQAIGDSPEKAGARLQIALDAVAESYGGFLQNSGATFQDAAAHVLGWVIENEASIKRFLAALSLFGKDLVAVLQPIAQTTVDIFKPVFSFIFQNAARGISAVRASLEALLQTDFAGASARAQKAVEDLYPNPVERALKGAQAYKEALNVELQTINNNLGSGYEQRVNTEAARLFKVFQPSQYGRPGADLGSGGLTGTDKDAKATEKAAAKERKNRFNELLDQLNARNKVLTQQGRLNEKVAQTESEKAALALLTAEELLDNEKAQLDLRLKYGEVSKQVYSQQQEAIRLEGRVVREEFNKTVKSINDKADSLVSAITGPGGLAGPTENPLQRASRELTDEIKKEQGVAKQLGGPRGEQAFKDLGAIDVNRVASFSVVGQDIVDLTNQVNELERGSKELTILEQLAQKYVQIWDDLDPKLQQQLLTLTAQKDALTKQKEAAQELKALYADIGMSIKEGVVGAIQGAIDGTKSLQQVATDLLNSIANRLLDVAVNMALFGVMSGTGTGGGLLGSLFKPKPNAMGNAYAQNGIVPFAMGGIVNRPTLFKFANGGAGNLGLMGEAGPEAIIPLKRGRDGKLGVVASGSEGGGGGGVVSVGEINITVQNTGETLSPGAQKQIAGQVQGIVLATLANERRSGGMLR